MVRRSSSDCGQFARAGLHAFEQAHVLDRDRRLVGKCRDQLDLLVGEWPHFRARQSQDANRDALAQHWNAEDCAVIAQSLRLDQGIFRISHYVGDMNDPAFEQRAPDAEPRSALIGISSDIIHEFARVAVGLRHDRTTPSFSRVMVALSASQSRAADSTSVCSTVCKSNVERLMTLSTSAVAVCCWSDSRSSLSSRVFSMAMTAWAAKVLDQFDLLFRERCRRRAK